MQDRFKFRVFDKENGEMFYPTKEDEHIEIDANGDLIGIDLEGLWCGGLNCILMQSTSLKDKNGKLIYEGDILLLKNEIPIKAVVEWVDDGYCVSYLNKIYKNCGSALIEWHKTEREVIGNVYENKELLGGANADV